MEFTQEDQGKSVFDADSEKIGVVVEVRDGEAYVEPEPSLAEELKAKLDWGDPEPHGDAYQLKGEWIDRIDDKEIILESQM